MSVFYLKNKYQNLLKDCQSQEGIIEEDNSRTSFNTEDLKNEYLGRFFVKNRKKLSLILKTSTADAPSNLYYKKQLFSKNIIIAT
jgi:dsDNA-binding SOS-regulon protein